MATVRASVPAIRRLNSGSILRLTALLALSWLAAPSATAARWLEISSDDFVMVTSLSEKKARSLLRDFEVLQFSVSRLIVGAETRPRIPTYVFALDSSDFSAITGGEDIVGLFIGGQFANHILYEQTRDQQRAREVIFHEYIHFVMHNNPGVIYPAWYNEGIAEVFSTLAERDGKIELGHPPRGGAYANLSLIPTQRVLEIDYRSPDFRAHRLLPQFYGQAWLMTHYLTIGSSERSRQVQPFLLKINKGAAPADAMKEAFGVDPAEFHSEIQSYRKPGKLRALQITFKDPLPTLGDAPVRVLGNSEAQALLGYAALRTNGDTQRAARYFERALGKDVVDPLAYAGAAVVKDADGRTEEATALLEQALAHPEAPRAQALAAELLLTRAERVLKEKPDDAEGRANALRARERYQSLLADASANNQAAYGYARAAMLLKDPRPSDVLAVVRPATARLPTSTRLAHLEAVLLLAVGDLANARTAAARAVHFAPSFEERKSMLAMLERIEKQVAESATQNAGQ